MKLYKLIPNGFNCRKDTQYRFGSLINKIFKKEMKNMQLSVFGSFLSSFIIDPLFFDETKLREVRYMCKMMIGRRYVDEGKIDSWDSR